MKVGIVGLPQVGKSTIFNLLTHGTVDTSTWGGRVEAHVGVAQVPDPRLQRLAELIKPKEVKPATVEYVDLPGLARGEGKAAADHAGEMSAYLHSLKNADALLHVVRAFQDPSIPHMEGSVDPGRDIDLFELEMIFADLAIVEKRLDRVSRDLAKMRSPELEMEQALLQRLKGTLEGEQPIRSLDLDPEEDKLIRGFTFLSAKPMLILINLGDDDAARIPRVVEDLGLQKQSRMPRVGITAVCGKVESEIAALPESDARLFMEEYGLESSGLTRIIRESYSLLGLLRFYTVGEPVRAWTIPHGTTAHQAAGVIHTDFEKGFIKAEVVSCAEFIELGSFHEARSRGQLRLEGKDYVVQEGDVIHFRFNV